jgi:hypothetical protein
MRIFWKPDKSANLGKRMIPSGAESWLGIPVLGWISRRVVDNTRVPYGVVS